MAPPSAVLVTCGVSGLAYSAVVIRRVRRQTSYEPVWQDWLWYALLPCAVYAALALASAALPTYTRRASFAVAGAALGLLIIGIHNAWDTVTHIVVPDEGDVPPSA
jgi:small-conductance mechanosensitive channel